MESSKVYVAKWKATANWHITQQTECHAQRQPQKDTQLPEDTNSRAKK